MTRGTTSYDVFDTVVTRQFAHPRDLFVHLGAQLRDRGAHRLAPLEFARARWAAELAARKLSPHTEVLLDDIYAGLARQLDWDAAAAQAAKELELVIESRHLRGIPLVRPDLAAARSASGRLVFLSDMYLPAGVLRPWLEREGIIEPADLLFISGEARTNKSSGGLFAAARQATGGTFAAWRHTGDHAYADVAKPGQLGIAATHFTAAHLTFRECRARGSRGEFAEVWRSLLAGAMRLARLERAPAGEREAVLWETGTTVAGPLFYGFVRWTLAEAKKRGLRRLYFVARDGQIFHRVAQAIQAADPQPVECIYLHASRLVFAGPAELAATNALRLLAAPTGHFHSLRQALLQLGLDEAWARRELPARFGSLELDANLAPDVREALADWLLAPERMATVQAAVARRAEQACGYLASVGLRAGEPVGLVDAGWLGSIQRNLERILGGDGTPAPLTGFYLGLMPPQPPRPAGELLGYTNAFGPLPLLREESHKVLIELMAQSDHGQVTGFQKRDGRWVPVLNAPGPVNLDEIRLFQEAVLVFTRRMLEVADIAAAPTRDFARAVIGLYRDFHDRPAAREAGVFGCLPHADQLFEQHHASLCAPLSAGQAWTAITDYRRRPPHWWVQGQAALGNKALLLGFASLKRLWWRLRGRRE
jgi:FMN phosphatase YigB (HAD superfamily)